jgi:hypothetical protein
MTVLSGANGTIPNIAHNYAYPVAFLYTYVEETAAQSFDMSIKFLKIPR